MSKAVLIALVASALVVAGCSGDGGGPSPTGSREPTGATGTECADATGGDQFTVTYVDFEIQPACQQVTGAQSPKVINNGDVQHSFTVVGTGLSVDLNPHSKYNFEATGLAPGTYTLQCRFHSQMTATLEVS